MDMKRKNAGYQKEKAVMIASGVLVLAAMTVTGVFVYRNNRAQEPEENLVDFSVLEDDPADGQVAQAENSTARNLTSGRQTDGELDYDPYYIEQERLLNEQAEKENAQASGAAAADVAADVLPDASADALSDPADALEGSETAGGMRNNVGYAMITRNGAPGLGAADGRAAGASEEDGQASDGSDWQDADGLSADAGQAWDALTAENGQEEVSEGTDGGNRTDGTAGNGTDGGTGDGEQAQNGENGTDQTALAEADGAAAGTVNAAGDMAVEAVADVLIEALNLHFSEDDALAWPIAGNILLNYSMDKTIYFPTLQQYKYNPSVVIASTQGTNVACAANGVVQEVYEDAQTGTTVVTSLGDGYELTYGQLDNVTVEEGDFVEAGVILGQVAAPTKYYSVEGTNVYLKMTKDGDPVNPLDYLG